jgi:transposase
MKPYSKEFRGQILSACDRGRSTREVATYFGVSESWVRRVKQERRELNKIAPCLKRRRTPLWSAFADRIRELIRTKPDPTLRELKAELQTDLSVQTLCTALQRLRLTVKKSPHCPRARAAGCRGEAKGVAAGAAAAESGSSRLHRRNVGQNEHDPSTRACSQRSAGPGQCAAWSLEDNDVPGGATHHGPAGPTGRGWGYQWRTLPGLGMPSPGTHPLAWRHRRDGQPRCPQGGGRSRGDRGHRSQACLSATVQPRSQPN